MKNKVKEIRKKLLELGFEESNKYGEAHLRITLNKGQDRAYHFVRWYEDEPETLYIDRAFSSGTDTITEERLLQNHNNLNTNSMNHYKEIKMEVEKILKGETEKGKETMKNQNTRLYLKEMENVQHNIFEEIGEFLTEDENGELYFEDEEQFEWWQSLFNALEKIEEKKSELGEFSYDGSVEDYGKQQEAAELRLFEFEQKLRNSINELGDYITFAEGLE